MPLSNFGCCSDLVWRSAQPDLKGLVDFTALCVGNSPVVMKLNDEMIAEETDWCAILNQTGIRLLDRRVPTFTIPDQKLLDLAREVERYRQAKQSVLVHCEHGRERTGLVVASWRVAYCGFDYVKARDEMRTYGMTGLVELFDRRLEAQLDRICELVASGQFNKGAP